jgi:hypothetical protein
VDSEDQTEMIDIVIYVWCIGFVVLATVCGMLTRRHEARRLRLAAHADAGCDECFERLVRDGLTTTPCERHVSLPRRVPGDMPEWARQCPSWFTILAGLGGLWVFAQMLNLLEALR